MRGGRIRRRFSSRSRPVAAGRRLSAGKVGNPGYPESYAGRWVAWDQRGGTIVASAGSLKEVRERARRAGYDYFLVERVPANLILGPPASGE